MSARLWLLPLVIFGQIVVTWALIARAAAKGRA
jgi:hypothetical protein